MSDLLWQSITVSTLDLGAFPLSFLPAKKGVIMELSTERPQNGASEAHKKPFE